jgi:5-methylcytosine-specific restriction enzyme B
MKPKISEFIVVANAEKTGLGTSSSAATFIRENRGEFEGLKTEISFGIGRASAIPWIAFTGFNQSVKNGVYPVYLYFKDFKVLILAYGVSETNQPEILWENAESKQTVQGFFEENYSKRPDKYGNSLVFKSYDINALPSEEVLKADLNELIETFKRQFSKGEKSKPKTPKLYFEVIAFQADLKSSGLVYTGNLVSRFSASLLTKPFLILTGLSGSGKTKLAQAFALWICQSNNQYKIVPVGADWTNREPLLGYPNSLDSKNYVKPDNGVLDLLLEASQEENKSKPHFLILDEMNLSHVERYFADFLSVMELSYTQVHPERVLTSEISLRKSPGPKTYLLSELSISMRRRICLAQRS